MKYVLILMALLLMGCGGSSTPCDFDILSFTNGATRAESTTHWACKADSNSYTFAAFADGTGIEINSGTEFAFTWEETGCREAHLTSALGGLSIFDIEGSVASGIITFTQRSDDTGQELNNSCSLENGALTEGEEIPIEEPAGGA